MTSQELFHKLLEFPKGRIPFKMENGTSLDFEIRHYQCSNQLRILFNIFGHDRNMRTVKYYFTTSYNEETHEFEGFEGTDSFLKMAEYLIKALGMYLDLSDETKHSRTRVDALEIA